jgi:hypothetical protein
MIGLSIEELWLMDAMAVNHSLESTGDAPGSCIRRREKWGRDFQAASAPLAALLEVAGVLALCF